MNPPDAVLFDLDGVLVDTYAVWEALVRDVARFFGCRPPTAAAFRRSWGQGIEEDAETFFPRRSPAEIQAAYEARYGGHLGRVRVMRGAARALAALPQPKAVVSNTPRALAALTLREAGLEARFRAVLGPDDVARSKPAPDMVLEACRRLGVAPARAYMVGDSDYDEKAAAAAGVPFERFRSFARLRLTARTGT